jgi:hypothetical protein
MMPPESFIETLNNALARGLEVVTASSGSGPILPESSPLPAADRRSLEERARPLFSSRALSPHSLQFASASGCVMRS